MADRQVVSLTRRQWHLIVREWQTQTDCGDLAAVMERAIPVIVARCDTVKTLDDIVYVDASTAGHRVVAAFCGRVEVLRWSVEGDLVGQLGAVQHG